MVLYVIQLGLKRTSYPLQQLISARARVERLCPYNGVKERIGEIKKI
jgi:hypothetical protein